MTSETPGPEAAPAEIPAAFAASDGHGPAPARQAAQGISVIAGMLSQLPQAIAAMLGQVVQAMPKQHVCDTCLTARLSWEAAHLRELEAAISQAKAAHGIAEDAPVPPGFDPVPFLPEHLRPGAPQGIVPVNPSVTTVNGTDYCAAHRGAQQGKRPLLIAQGSLSPSMFSQFAG